MTKTIHNEGQVNSLSNILEHRSTLNYYVNFARSMLPYPMSDFDNTGILIFGFLIITILIHIANVFAFSSSSRMF